MVYQEHHILDHLLSLEDRFEQDLYRRQNSPWSQIQQHQHQSKLELKKQAAAQTKEFEIVYALPSLTSFLYHDPAKNIEDFSKPVLGLFGGKDLQVTIDQNKDIMEKALLTAPAVPYLLYSSFLFNSTIHPFKAVYFYFSSSWHKQLSTNYLIHTWVINPSYIPCR